MTRLGVRTAWLAAVAAAVPGIAAAQFPPPPGQPSVQQRWPQPQAQPSPQAQPAPAPAAPAGQAAPKPKNDDAAAAAPKPKPKPAAAPAHVVACSGPFAKDSTHLKLAMRFDSRNITFGEVDGPDGSKIKASILFPGDPRRRLEVLWNNDAARTDVSVIAINGHSQWTAPKGLRLGTNIAALEKANGRPFKLTGFGADGSASVVGWEGGALSTLPGGCKVGIRLGADKKSPEAARKELAADKEFLSNDAKVRAIKPAILEILIGY
jgi:hypothetical protein